MIQRIHSLTVSRRAGKLIFLHEITAEGREDVLRATSTKIFQKERVRELAAEVLANLKYPAAETSAGRVEWPELQKAGSDLYDVLFPSEVTEELHGETANSYLIFHLPRSLIWIPWELAYADECQAYLCQHFRVSRSIERTHVEAKVLREQYQRDRGGEGGLIAVGSIEGLDASAELDDVGKELRRLYPSAVSTLRNLSAQELQRHLKQNYEIFHFFGHGEFQEGAAERTGWKAADAKLLSCKDIENISSKAPFPLLIFANACHSASSGSPRAEQYVSDLALTFIKKGVPHYIGTLTHVPDAPARDFARMFYRCLADGHSIGEALSEARRIFFGKTGPPIWAYYVHYGDPRHAFLSQEQHLGASTQEAPHQPSAFKDHSSLVNLQEELERLGLALVHEGRQRAPAGGDAIIGLRFSEVSDVFRDRQDTISDLRRLLSEQGAKLICVVGPGGFGKTAVVSKLCAEIENGELRLSETATEVGADGIVYISCRGTDMPTMERLFHDFGRTLGSPHSDDLLECWKDASRGLDDKSRFLLSRLRCGRYFLVLDNVEEILGPDNAIADSGLRAFVELCLSTPHGLRLIVTSRETILLGPQVARAARFLPLSRGLPTEEAVGLMRDLDPHGELGLRDASSDLLVDAAKRCYGVPRALESMAGILATDPTLTLEELLHGTSLFDDQVLQNLVGEHYSRVTEDQRRVLEALAIYNRPVPVGAVLELLVPFCRAIDAHSCLSALVRSYFVTHQRGRGTYELHPLDQQYVYARIPDGNVPVNKYSLHRGAAEYFKKQRKPLTEWKRLTDVEPQLSEIHHLLCAADYENACTALNNIDPYPLDVWGCYQLVAGIRELLTENLADPHLSGMNWTRLGSAVFNLGDPERAIGYFKKALHLATMLDDKREIASRIGHLGEAYLAVGHLDEASEHFRKSYESFSEMGLNKEAGFWLGHLGLVHSRIGTCDVAQEYFARARAVARGVGDRRAEGSWLSNLGDSSLRCGCFHQAFDYYSEAVAIARELNDRRGLVARLCGLARTLCTLGKPQEAISYHKEAMEIASAIKNRYGEAKNALFLGKVFLTTPDIALAKGYLTHALALDAPESNYKCLAMLGALALQEGALDLARDYFHRCIATCSTLLQSTPKLYDALNCMGLSQLGTGNAQEALVCYKEAAEVCPAKGVWQEVANDLHIFERDLRRIDGFQSVLDYVRAMQGGNEQPEA